MIYLVQMTIVDKFDHAPKSIAQYLYRDRIEALSDYRHLRDSYGLKQVFADSGAMERSIGYLESDFGDLECSLELSRIYL